MVEREKRFRMNGVGRMRVFGENGGARKERRVARNSEESF